jgi:hypothetical protein
MVRATLSGIKETHASYHLRTQDNQGEAKWVARTAR